MSLFVRVSCVALTVIGLGCSSGDDGAASSPPPTTNAEDGPPAGNPDGHADVPAEARAAGNHPELVVHPGPVDVPMEEWLVTDAHHNREAANCHRTPRPVAGEWVELFEPPVLPRDGDGALFA